MKYSKSKQQKKSMSLIHKKIDLIEKIMLQTEEWYELIPSYHAIDKRNKETPEQWLNRMNPYLIDIIDKDKIIRLCNFLQPNPEAFDEHEYDPAIPDKWFSAITYHNVANALRETTAKESCVTIGLYILLHDKKNDGLVVADARRLLLHVYNAWVNKEISDNDVLVSVYFLGFYLIDSVLPKQRFDVLCAIPMVFIRGVDLHIKYRNIPEKKEQYVLLSKNINSFISNLQQEKMDRAEIGKALQNNPDFLAFRDLSCVVESILFLVESQNTFAVENILIHTKDGESIVSTQDDVAGWSDVIEIDLKPPIRLFTKEPLIN